MIRSVSGAPEYSKSLFCLCYERCSRYAGFSWLTLLAHDVTMMGKGAVPPRNGRPLAALLPRSYTWGRSVPGRRQRMWRLSALWTCLALIALPPVAHARDTLVVMTQNQYLGADLTPLGAAFPD